MRAWSIGEVAKLLGVKPHVIRYWESELPLLSPKKGLSGRREYSANEVRLLMRFRHLLYEQKFTIEGAKNRLWEELGSVPPDIAARFAEIRSDLIEALMTTRRGERSGREGESIPTGLRDHQAGSQDHHAGIRDGGTDIRDRLEEIGQGHLFAHWESRPQDMRRRILEDLVSLDLATVQELRAAVLAAERGGPSGPGTSGAETSGPGSSGLGASGDNAGIEPAPYVPLSESARDPSTREEGEEEIRRGRIAFLTVAGGQGSRLGFDGPKGMFPVTPIRRLTLFALFAEKLLAARRRYAVKIPWLIMTGPHNHAATEEYFEAQEWFGLGGDTVHLFAQAILPSFSPDGRLVMAPDGGLFFNPDGHGGVVEALRTAGLLERIGASGVEHLFCFQVDNPLVRVPDPLFLGFHCRARSRISSKVIEKAYPEEKLGIIVRAAGRLAIIEYSDLDERRMRERGADGRLLFAQGSPAIHLLDVSFLGDRRLVLPWHLARKKAMTLNPVRAGTETQEREVVKLEKFIFDAIPLADRALFFETERAEEFAPLKNREGMDSIETCFRGQVELAARWLTDVGVEVPRDENRRSRHVVEISPLFALDRQGLAARRGQLPDRIDEDTLLA